MTLSRRRAAIANAKDAGRYNPSRAERQRLQRILDDERYGPKLVRLTNGEQRVILDLISANDGRQARQLILELDEARRENNRVMRRVSRYANLPRSQRVGAGRPDDEEALFWRLYDGLVA